MRNIISEAGVAISASAVEELELLTGHALPLDYKLFLLKYNGGIPRYSHFKTKNVFLDITCFLTIEKGNVYDLLTTRMQISDRIDVDKYLPIAETGEGDMAVLGFMNGGIYFWQHDQAVRCDSEYDEMVYLSPSFSNFIDCLYAPPSDEIEVDRIGKHGSVDEMNRYLATAGPVINKYGHSIGSIAIQSGNLRLVDEWYRQGRDVNDAMHIAAMNGIESVVDFLLKRGVDINILNAKGKTPLDVALWNDNYAAMLKKRGAKTSKELRAMN